MSKTDIQVLNARPIHTKGRLSHIEIGVSLDYLKNRPLAVEVLSADKALELAEQLITAVRITERVNQRKIHEGTLG